MVVTGKGEVVFDKKAGMPKSLKYRATLKYQVEDAVVRRVVVLTRVVGRIRRQRSSTAPSDVV